jgi:hypothetical protein
MVWKKETMRQVGRKMESKKKMIKKQKKGKECRIEPPLLVLGETPELR